MSLFAPNVKTATAGISRYSSAPQRPLGYDNRNAGLRAHVAARRSVASKIAWGARCENHYLAIAASLACGIWGWWSLKPFPSRYPEARRTGDRAPAHLGRGPFFFFFFFGLRLMRRVEAAVDLFGDRFVLGYTQSRKPEYETFAQVISSWEREHLCERLTQAAAPLSCSAHLSHKRHLQRLACPRRRGGV